MSNKNKTKSASELEQDLEAAIKDFANSIVGLLLIVVSAAFTPFVFMLLWNWFMTDATFGLPTLNWLMSAGILLVVDFAMYRDTSWRRPKDMAVAEKIERNLQALKASFSFTLVTLTIGFVLQFFI